MEPATVDLPVHPPLTPQPQQACQPTFSGSGSDYFRLWIVNLLLSVITLGIYSAWAKVRRMQYFARHTQLAGASFDFRGSPLAVLRGRLIALVLLLAYRATFGMAALTWILAFLAAVALLPILIRGAMRFRLANTFYRGIAFDFGGSVAGGYRALAPVIVFVLLPGMVIALTGSKTFDDWSTAFFVVIPLLHFSLIRYRMANIWYGSLQATVALPTRQVWRIYIVNGGAVILLIGVAVFSESLIGNEALRSGVDELLSLYVLYLVAIPLFTARLANLAWSNTCFPGLSIRSSLPAAAYVRMQTANLLLTLVTLGLFRPFAVVRTYRFRVAHLSILQDGEFETRAGAVARARPGATGDGATDLFDIDISL